MVQIRISRSRLDAMIEEAIVDAYDESEQRGGFCVMFDEHLHLPFTTQVLGVEVTVTAVGQNDAGEIVAVCTRGRTRQMIPILDLPLPDPAPPGAEWIEAYRRWARDAR